MEVKKKKMETKKGEGKGQRQKVVIGIFAAVVIAALFTVTIGIGMNNSDTGNGVVGKSDLGDTITAYDNDGEATSSKDVMLHGVTQQNGYIRLDGRETQVIYEGTSGFFITIIATQGEFYVKCYIDGKQVGTSTKLLAEPNEQDGTTLSYGYGKGEYKCVKVAGTTYDISKGTYEIS